MSRAAWPVLRGAPSVVVVYELCLWERARESGTALGLTGWDLVSGAHSWKRTFYIADHEYNGEGHSCASLLCMPCQRLANCSLSNSIAGRVFLHISVLMSVQGIHPGIQENFGPFDEKLSLITIDSDR